MFPRFGLLPRRTSERLRSGVWDNGDGIPEEYLDKIFQPFFSAGSPGEGTGLGLSIAHEIVVNLHQGTLEVDSHVGEGTEFLIRLPAS